MNIIETIVKKSTQKQAENILKQLVEPHGCVVIKKYKSRDSYKQLKELTAIFHNFYFTWNNVNKTIVLIKTDNEIPENFKNDKDGILKYQESDYIQEQIKQGTFSQLEFLAEQIFEKIKEENAFKLIKKVSSNGKNIPTSILKTLEKQDPDNIKTAILIEEKYTKHIWFIYSYQSAIASCFANLNDNLFAEFGSVRFSDITTGFWLESGSDDNNFSMQILNFNKHPTYQEISKICER